MNIQESLNIGVRHHQAGELQQAEAIYRQILAENPDQPQTLHLLGVMAHQCGRRDVALQLIAKAISVAPNHAEFHGSIGLALADEGRLDEAVRAYRRAIALQPNLAPAYNNLGNVLAVQGKTDEAIAFLKQAMTLQPNYPDPPYNIANLLSAIGRLDEAVAGFQRAIALRPNWPQALNNLGIVHKKRGEIDQSIACFNAALAAAPDYAAALNNLGDVLCETGRFDEAIGACRLAIQVRPNQPEAHNNLGNALCAQTRYEEAIASYQQAMALRPDYIEAHNNLGNVYHAQAEFEQALALYRAALALKPDHPSAHWNIGLVHLMQGDYEKGWPEFEWRWRVENIRLHGRRYTQPLWDGSDLNGQRILLHAEQAIGDTIFFLRYVPRVAAKGGKIVLACQRELLPLVQGMAAVEAAVALDEAPPPCDVRYSLMGLPGIFKTTLENIPAEPYLSAHPGLVEAWKARVPADGRKKVGLAWANRADPPGRCPAVADWGALAGTSGVWFTSLQKDRMGGEAPPNLDLTDWTGELNNFAETAALIANLDLIITVDTAVAHLAGAMGKPTWLILKRVPDWRWMMDRGDSPWYPSMRLFRREDARDWREVIDRVVEELKE